MIHYMQESMRISDDVRSLVVIGWTVVGQLGLLILLKLGKNG